MKKARELLNSAQDFLNSPKAQSVSRFGRKTLQLASTIAQANLSGPLGAMTTALGTFDVIADLAKEDSHVFMRRTACEYDMEPCFLGDYISLSFMMLKVGIMANAKEIFNDSFDSIFIYEFDDGSALMFEGRKGGGKSSSIAIRDAFYAMHIDKVIKNITEMFWKQMGTDFISTSLDKNGGIQLSPMLAPDFKVTSAKLTRAEVVRKIKSYRKHGVVRSFLLAGPPGTGKTTFCFSVAADLKGRAVVISPEVLDRISGIQFENMVVNIGCQFLILEDIDRTENSQLLLTAIESVRKARPDLIIFSSVNHANRVPDALKRPGRLGERLYFKSPELEERKELLTLYSGKYGVGRDLTHLAKEMNHELYSHDYVRDACEMALVSDDDELIEYIRATISDLGDESQ